MNHFTKLCLGLGAVLCLSTATPAALAQTALPTYAPDTTTDIIMPNSNLLATPPTDVTVTKTTVLAPNMLFDEHFLADLVHGNRAELAFSDLALTHSSNPQVIEFARHMLADHTALGIKVDQMLMGSGIYILPGLRYEQELAVNDLSTMRGNRFDRHYMRQMVRDHQATAALLQDEIHRNNDPTCVALASEALPTVQQHLAMADNINVALGGHHVNTEATGP